MPCQKVAFLRMPVFSACLFKRCHTFRCSPQAPPCRCSGAAIQRTNILNQPNHYHTRGARAAAAERYDAAAAAATLLLPLPCCHTIDKGTKYAASASARGRAAAIGAAATLRCCCCCVVFQEEAAAAAMICLLRCRYAPRCRFYFSPLNIFKE